MDFHTYHAVSWDIIQLEWILSLVDMKKKKDMSCDDTLFTRKYLPVVGSPALNEMVATKVSRVECSGPWSMDECTVSSRKKHRGRWRTQDAVALLVHKAWWHLPID
jgi:hypothetical protein